MTSRMRILNIIDRKPVDRIPADIWYTPEVSDLLMKYFSVKNQNEVYEILGIDKIAWIEAVWTGALKGKKNMWGSTLKEVSFGKGTYTEVVTYPLKGSQDEKYLARYKWPDLSDFSFDTLCSDCNKNKQWARMLSFISIFEHYCKLKPLDESLMDLYLAPSFAHRLIEIILNFEISYIEKAFEICGDLIDIVYLSDDMGMQDRPILPLDKWKEFFLDPYSRLIKLIKGYGKKVFYHSDGSAFDILEQMVILGVDVINPVQYRCPGMEREKLKKELGSRVVFHGAVENQKIIPFGSPEEVKEEVRDNLRILGRGGGYICAPCHNIQPGTPVENIKALFETVAKEGHLYL